MRLLVVTRQYDGKKIYINPELICAIYPSDEKEDATIIQFIGDENSYIIVSEKMESVFMREIYL